MEYAKANKGLTLFEAGDGDGAPLIDGTAAIAASILALAVSRARSCVKKERERGD